jgi:hypothetical protein
MRTLGVSAPRAAVVLLVVLASSACGYSLAGRGSFLPSYIQIVAIPPVENRTPYIKTEQILTDRIRIEFIGRPKYRIVNETAGADAVLRAVITQMSIQPVGLDKQQLASRYLFTLTMQVTFEDLRAGEVLWSNDALTFREEYELSSGTIEGASFVDQQRPSYERMATDAARTVVTAILEAF